MKTNARFWSYLAHFFLLRELFQTKCRENQDMHFIFKFLVRKSSRLWDNVQKYCWAGWPHMTIWCMRIACWIPKAKNVLPEWVTLPAFPLQQLLHERSSVLCTLPAMFSLCLVTLITFYEPYNYKISYYTAFWNLMLLPLSYVKIFLSPPSSATFSWMRDFRFSWWWPWRLLFVRCEAMQ
jgi:hypothetical protein